MRRTCERTEGSTPSLSATKKPARNRGFFCGGESSLTPIQIDRVHLILKAA